MPECQPAIKKLASIVVPDVLVRELKAAVCETEDAAELTLAIEALGGERRCFERFLLARNLKVAAAASMLRDTIAYRREVVARMLPIDSTVRARVAPLWPGWICGRCCVTSERPCGQAVQYFRFGDVDPRSMLALVTEQEFRTFYTHWMEASLQHELACNNPSAPSCEWKGM